MMNSLNYLALTGGVILLIGACISSARIKNKTAVFLVFALGLFFTSAGLYTGGLGMPVDGIKTIETGQLFYLESDPVISGSDGDILVLLLPIPVEAFVGNVSNYIAKVIVGDPFYCSISADEIEQGLKKGDTVIKINGKLQKFKPVGS